MISITLQTEISIKALTRWATQQQEQAILATNIGSIFLFHGSNDAEYNLGIVTKYQKQIMKADKIICCHSAFFPKWVQDKAVLVGTGTVTVSNYGDSNVYLQQN